MTIYGYARVSTTKQNISRQIDNIKSRYPEAVIIAESYTGTTMQRPAWDKLRKAVKPGDTIVFDEVSRMSRNAADGFEEYRSLYEDGITLEFIKEPYINTEVYRTAREQRIAATISTGNAATDTFTAAILDAVNQLLLDLARQQMTAAFEQAQAEVDHLHQRTSEGVKRAQAMGKPVGRKQGASITTARSIEGKAAIKKYSRDFNGTLTDADVMKLTGLARNTFYKYKRELMLK